MADPFGVIYRRDVFGLNGGCVIGTEHTHENAARCFDLGHTLRRVDDLMTPTARFQHGDNPEHSLVIDMDDALDDGPCLGFIVDEWIGRIHDRAAASSTTEETRG